MSGLWDLLRGIVPQEPLRIGTIATVNAGGTVTCNMANGGQLVVRGTGTVGDVVYIQFGQVQGTVTGQTTFADQDV